jgi:flagellar basal-body rod protein FlgF
MDHGLYSTYLGMRSRQRTLDMIANNIANASTPGFKADRMLYRSVQAAEKESGIQFNLPGQQPELEAVGNGQSLDRSMASIHGRNVSVITNTMANHAEGELRKTDRPLDIALDGDGFLAVQTSRGERYTRAGALKLNTSNQLVTPQGDLIVGENGPITLPGGDVNNVNIGQYGDVSANGQVVGRLKLVSFDNPQNDLMKEGETYFYAPDAKGKPSTSTRVVQNTLEMSNVNPMSEMAAMLQNSREFETLQRSVTTLMNDLGRKVASEIGRL